MKILLVSLLIMTSAFAQETSTKKEITSDSVEKIVKEGKKDRKKKAEMCHDCGKPETECTCKGH